MFILTAQLKYFVYSELFFNLTHSFEIGNVFKTLIFRRQFEIGSALDADGSKSIDLKKNYKKLSRKPKYAKWLYSLLRQIVTEHE